MKRLILTYTLLVLLYTAYGQKTFSSDPNFFPIAVWLQEPNNAAAYRAAGINLYIGLWNNLNQEQYNLLKNADMKVICSQNEFGLEHLDDPILYGWIQQDEPDNAQWNNTTQEYDPCIDPMEIRDIYDTIKAHDPSRPVNLNLGQGVAYTDWIGRGDCTGKTEMYPEYMKGGDIVSFDIYPVNSSDPKTKEKLWYVAKGMDSLEAWSAGEKPLWTWIETTKINDGSNRQPTPEEVNAEVWMALIHGATGFGYFCHSWTPSFDDAALLHDPVMLPAIKKINSQVRSLAPVLNSSTVENLVTVTSSNPDVPIDLMTKYYQDSMFIFTVAMRPGATTATFNIPSGADLTVIDENRTIKGNNFLYTDAFDSSYAVHLYRLNIIELKNKISESDLSFSIYPNPATSTFTVQLPAGLSGEYSLDIYTLQGKLLASGLPLLEQTTTFTDVIQGRGLFILAVKNKSGGYIGTQKMLVR